MKHTLVVDSTAARLDVFIGQKLALSRTRLKALFEAGLVKVNGRRVKKGHEAHAGEVVEVELDDAPREAVADASLALTVLWEDDELVFVDKPAGVPSQPLAVGETGTVANALVARYPDIAKAGDDPREAGLVHRLDVETSGVLLAAKTRASWEALRREFGGDSDVLDKRYLALVTGPLADEGEIDLPLAHHGDHVRAAVQAGDARPARSRFEVVARQGDFALVNVRIYTGVLHQVRAHLAAVGAPIYGDALYGGRPATELGRFFLHAARLTVPHPVTKRPVTVECPLPEALAAVLARELPNLPRLPTERAEPSPLPVGRGLTS